VVFVHGLGGGGFKTWNAGAGTELGFWPLSLAARNPECAVWTVNYRTTILDYGFSSSLRMGLLDRAAWFIDALQRESVAAHPIVFIAHSLGGLIVKQALQFAHSMGGPEWQAIWKQTRAVVFLASPHDGSFLANFATAAASITGLPRWLVRTSPIVKELHKDHPALRYLKPWYRDHSVAAGIRTLAFAERREYLKSIVVEASSADPGIPNQEPVRVLPEDHLSIAKPAAPSSPVYADVEKLVRDLATTGAQSARPDLMDRICGDWWGMVDTPGHESALACIRIRKSLATGLPALEGKSFGRAGNRVAEWFSRLCEVAHDRHHDRITFNYLYEASRLPDSAKTLLLGHAEVEFDEPADPRELAQRGRSKFISIYKAEKATDMKFGTATRRAQEWVRALQSADFESLWAGGADEQRKEVVLRTLETVWGLRARAGAASAP
jgi:hypothetical protein